MPRAQQVYGKRSRANHDPFAIFASPQRPQYGKKQDEIDVLVDQVGELQLYQKAREGRWPVAERMALGERSPNAGLAKREARGEKKCKRPARRKVLEEDGGNQEQPELGNNENTVEEVKVAEDCATVVSNRNTGRPEPQTKAPKKVDGPQDPCEAEELALQQEEQTTETAHTPETPLEPEVEALPPSLPASRYSDHTDAFTHHTRELLNLSAHGLASFTSWSQQISAHFDLTKIAEASFGEVYRLSLLSQLPGFSRADESVFKVIALTPPEETLPKGKKDRKAALKKAEAMSKPEDVASEVKLLQRMSSIPGFTNFRDVRILQGRPGEPFVEAFKAFNQAQKAKKKDLSIFPDPGKKVSYSEDQLWAVIEMQDAGTDLEKLIENGECTAIWNVWDIFWQVVLTLAKGEEGAEFEHRDLHLGNICVRPAPGAASSPDPALAEISGKAQIDTKTKLGFTDLETTIIDYTISRCLLRSETDDNDEGVAYHDLSQDPSVFEGDSTEEYQYDIYRYMRGAALYSDPYWEPPYAEPNHNDPNTSQPSNQPTSWRFYTPITNLIWLHFILYKLLEQLDWPSATKAPPRKRKPADYAAWKRANDLEHKLLRTQELLDPDVICQGDLTSCTDLVALALGEGWLDEADIVGVGAGGGVEDDEVLLREKEVGEEADEQGSLVPRGRGEESANPSSDLASSFTHLQINVATMEERGLEAAEREAKASRKLRRR
ncbi:hypothetical protein KC332_g3285 [Hortaea werneckii]|uniref:non-specific serine/threonine protein kinase n=2 Tax=Hortaea werneckii TaxID=91943 RepID=A0A3M7HNF2_HORWE|nr:hypothetical protein KC350_g14046 [Hortaea werneckii]OTA31540.1 hypothetical protein BTJ68_08487 [Hortaea werneckii EXF-2000]KAI6832403.1 hypothetical protein KC358_g6376 [Hortaea werneckii]KAI6930849.1 hypothetical protein KC341_g9960 [Hortaea werneckii]KAI6932537.1 hypothetical protein KC348_g6962 [Hortaea werneckii]